MRHCGNDIDSRETRDENLEFNRTRWGSLDNWQSLDRFGYRWGNGHQQQTGDIAELADNYLRPYIRGRYDHTILELSPGGGRFTAELIRYAKAIDLLDMNAACLEVCRERFKFYPTPMGFFANDGMDCSCLGERTYSFIACYDSMVHMHPEIIETYVRQFSARLEPGAALWLDHSGAGERERGHRTAMTDKLMAGIGAKYGLAIEAQMFRNKGDCITVLRAQ